MREYETIAKETMGNPSIHRMTPYQFALTAEPRQFIVKCETVIVGVMHQAATSLAPSFPRLPGLSIGQPQAAPFPKRNRT